MSAPSDQRSTLRIRQHFLQWGPLNKAINLALSQFPQQITAFEYGKESDYHPANGGN